MSDSDQDPLSSLLSSFALGPAWARSGSDKPERSPKSFSGGDSRPPRRDDRDRGPREGGGPRDRDGAARRPFQTGGRGPDDRRVGPPRFEEIRPEEGVRVTIAPDAAAIHLIGKEVQQVARVYGLFDVAKILLAEKSRCRAIFEAHESHAPFIMGKRDESLFLTREEAIRHLWSSELRAELIEEETIEVDPPTGNFQAIARCGISGEWLGPVNFHSYQTNLRRLHRERFANLPFEVYASKVRTERGEESVNAWLETMKQKTRWRIKGEGDESWIDDRAEAERVVASHCFDTVFREVRTADVSGAISAKQLSPKLLASLKEAGSHARQHPAILIPAVCRAIEAEHMPVFKRLGKLHTGPARPNPLPANAVLAERPSEMVTWIRENKPAKLEGLWKAVLPEGSTAPSADYAADLFWLLHQGHILLYTDDTLAVQEPRESGTAEPPGDPKKAKKKKKSKKSKSTTQGATAPGSKDEPAAAPTEPSSSAEPTEPSDDGGAAVIAAGDESSESSRSSPVVAVEEVSLPVESAPAASVEENPS